VKKIIWFVLGLMICSAAFAEVPKQLSYSGKLTDKNNNLLPDGNYNMLFSFYTAATGGTAVWSEQHNAGLPTDYSVPVKAGAFNVLLGSVNHTLPDFSQSQNQNLWLQTEAWINGVDEVFGRRAMVSVAYARQAEMANSVADNSVTSAKIMNGAVTAAKISSLPTITGGMISAQTITGANLANGTITQTQALFAPTVNGGVANPKIVGGIAVTAGGMARINLTGFTSVYSIMVTPARGDRGIVAQVVDTSYSAAGFDVQTRYNNDDSLANSIFFWMVIGN